MNKTKPLAVLTALLALLVAGCGSEDTSHSPSTKGGAGNRTDAAFVADMVAHHQGAIDMAELADERAEHPEVRRLAKNIIRAQKAEITVMDGIGADLHHMGVADGHMGMSEHDMGMDADMPMLESAKPFDRAFIDMMIPHHQGAIRMARRQLAGGRQPRLRKLSEAIIASQGREIAQMRAWRERWYGGSKSGKSGSTMHDGSMMDGAP